MVRKPGKPKAKRTFHAIAEELRATIHRGELTPGDKLPAERDLGEQFGVSRLVIREALRCLEQEGLIWVKRGHGGGSFVARPNTRPVQDSLVAMLRTGQISMDDLAEARSIYEPEVARLAALRVNAEELGRIAEVVSRQEAALRAGGHQEEFDLMFHRLVAEATKNPVLVTAMNSIVNTLLPEVRELNLDRSVQKSIVDFHQKIYQALKARDPERAYNLMAEHVVDVQKRLAKLEAVYRSRRASST
jgi:GntR family transcriptional repressor for pyruvate dehydrogenase complex